MISHDQFQAPTGQMNLQHTGNVNTTFELRDEAVERSKKRLERYRKTAQKKEIDQEAFLDAKLRYDMKETQKYLAKVNESKIRKNKNKDSKKDLPGVGGLSKAQSDIVHNKIREQIQNDLKISRGDKKKKSPDPKRAKSSHLGFGDSRFNELPALPIDQISSDPTLNNFPSSDFMDLSDRDIQTVLGEVKRETTTDASSYDHNQHIPVTSVTMCAPVGTSTATVPSSAHRPEDHFYPSMYTNANLYQQHIHHFQQQQLYGNGGQYNAVASPNQWDQRFQHTQFQHASAYHQNSNAQLHDFLSNQYS